MRIAIISDVHSNLEAFEAVLEDMYHDKIDEKVNLGDLVGYGPSPKEVIELNREHGFATVMGNHDHEITLHSKITMHNKQARLAIDINKKMLSEEDIKYLASLKTSFRLNGIHFVHGIPPNNFKGYVTTEEDGLDFNNGNFTLFNGDICFVGHTHRTFIFPEKGNVKVINSKGKYLLEQHIRHVINIGSVGQPRDGTPEAKYAIFNTKSRELEVRAVKSNYQKTFEKMLLYQLPDPGRVRTGR